MSKKAEDCHFFIIGHCNKGDSCEFRHKEGIRERPSCIQWLLEQCNNVNCPNKHLTLPRQKDGARIVCYYNQGCTRPDCTYLHTGTIASPAAPRPDKETPVTETLTPRDAKSAVPAKATPVPSGKNAPVPPAADAAAKPDRQQKRAREVPELAPLRSQTRKQNPSGEEPAAPKQSFVKSFEEIMKEKASGNTPAPVTKSQTAATAKANNKPARQAPAQQKSAEAATPAKGRTAQAQPNAKRTPNREAEKETQKANSGKKRPAAQKDSNATSATPAARPSFGVKSLDELLREREAEQTKQPKANAASLTKPTSPANAGVKRPREETPATTNALPQPQQKQARPSPAPPQPSASDADDLDIEAELGELGEGEDLGEIDDDELKELLGE